jgi:anti-sigma regulatory factor (Ser/Thr protein kinase)
MLDDILGVLQLLVDPNTRATAKLAIRSIGGSDGDWKRSIKTTSAKFSGDESFRVGAVADLVHQRLRELAANSGGSRGGPSMDDVRQQRRLEKTIDNFGIVFSELVSNAFEHGCKDNPSGRVKLRITYSRWFILLDVQDSGAGFNLQETLAASQGEPHGLGVVKQLTYRLTSNKKGNRLTALIAGPDELDIQATVESYKGSDILNVEVASNFWSRSRVNWAPVRLAIERHPQTLVLINAVQFDWASGAARRVSGVKVLTLRLPGSTPPPKDKERYYALCVTGRHASLFDLDRLNSETFRVFRDEEAGNDPKDWLTEQASRLHGHVGSTGGVS